MATTIQNPLASEKNPELVFNNAFPGVDLNIEQVISGPGVFGCYPITEKKNKFRTCYVVLRNCICELHKSIKEFEQCRPAAHCIDLRLVFNVCILKEVITLKSDALCVMTPTETYFINLDKQKIELQEFYEEFLERSREARSTLLIRPVYRDEYFEAAFDVQIIRKPKLQKEFSNTENYTDLTIKHDQMLGHRRICVRPTSIVLFKTGIRPSNDIDNIYTRDCFFDFPINMISTYGKQERFYFIQVGQCCEFGKGEVWMQCETSGSAKAMHERIDEINHRESDKRREMGIVLSYPGMSNRAIKTRSHRERMAHARGAQNQHSTEQNDLNKVDENLKQNADQNITTEKRGRSFFDVIRRKETKELTKSPKPDNEKKAGFSSLFRFSKDKKPKKDESIEDPAVENMIEEDSETATSNYPKYKNEDDYMPYDHRVDSRKASEVVEPFRQISISSNPRKSKSTTSRDYVEMNNNPVDNFIVKKEYVYPFIEAQVYISNLPSNSETLQSASHDNPSISSLLHDPESYLEDEQPSTSDQMPQQFDTSSINSSNLINIHPQRSVDEESDVPTDLIDIRKRAHSLGSRSWIKSAALRKLNNKINTNTSARNATSPANNISQPSSIGVESTEDERSRIGSTGSQTSWNTGSRRNTNQFDEEEDLYEIDFETKNKTDSPLNRSRNSSLGMKTPAEIKTALDLALEERQREQALLNKKREQKRREKITTELEADIKGQQEISLDDRRIDTTPIQFDKSPDKNSRVEDEYVQFQPASSTMSKSSVGEITGKKHRNNCRRTRNDTNTSPKSNLKHTRKEESQKKPLNSSKASSSTTVPEDGALNRHGSSDSLETFERVERGEGMIVINEEPIEDSLLAQRLMRPLSKSIGANHLFNTNRQRTNTNTSNKEGIYKKDCHVRKYSNSAGTKDKISNRRKSGISRLFRSPSPQSRNVSCTNPSCCVCLDDGKRPRTSFIDSDLLLSSPASSRKHSTNAAPILRERNSSSSRSRNASTSRERNSPSIKRKISNSGSTSSRNLPANSQQRKIGTVSAVRKVPIMADFSPFDLNESGPSSSRSEDTYNRRHSVFGRKSSTKCRRRRKNSYGLHRTYYKRRDSSIPASIHSVDYVEIIAQPNSKSKERIDDSESIIVDPI